jgi:hypothetical protein
MSLQLSRLDSRSSQAADVLKSPSTREIVSKEAVVTEELDVLSQLRANISVLEDMHGRLAYMMGEVEKLIRKKL